MARYEIDQLLHRISNRTQNFKLVRYITTNARGIVNEAETWNKML